MEGLGVVGEELNAMATNIERASRWVAMAALVASAAFFGWYGFRLARGWPAIAPFFGGFVLAWLAALYGIGRRRFWGHGYTTGLSLLSLSLLSPAGEPTSAVGALRRHRARALGRARRAGDGGAPGSAGRRRLLLAARRAGVHRRAWRCPGSSSAGLLPGGGTPAARSSALAGLGGRSAARGRGVPQPDLGALRDDSAPSPSCWPSRPSPGAA